MATFKTYQFWWGFWTGDIDSETPPQDDYIAVFDVSSETAETISQEGTYVEVVEDEIVATPEQFIPLSNAAYEQMKEGAE